MSALFYVTIGPNKSKVPITKSELERVAGIGKNKWLTDSLMEYGLSRLDSEASNCTGGAVHITGATFFYQLMIEYKAWSADDCKSNMVGGLDMI